MLIQHSSRVGSLSCIYYYGVVLRDAEHCEAGFKRGNRTNSILPLFLEESFDFRRAVVHIEVVLGFSFFRSINNLSPTFGYPILSYLLFGIVT